MPTISFKAAVLAGFACCLSAVSLAAVSRAADSKPAEESAPPAQQPSSEQASSQPKKGKQPAKAKPAPIADAREMLELFGVEPSYFAALVDGHYSCESDEAIFDVLDAGRDLLVQAMSRPAGAAFEGVRELLLEGFKNRGHPKGTRQGT